MVKFRNVNPILTFCFVFGMAIPGWAQSKKDCSCPVLECGPCQNKVTTGKVVKFCDWGDINVCRKETCENVNFYFGCISQLKKNQKEEKGKGDLELDYDDESKKNRNPASTNLTKKKKRNSKGVETEGRIATENLSRVDPGQSHSDVKSGKVLQASKGLQLLHRGKPQPLKSGQELYVDDEIFCESQKDQMLTLQFSEGTVTLKFHPKTKVSVQDPHSILGRFQPFLYLVHGQVDYEVKMQEGSFDLLAGQILARTRMGKMFVGYEMGVEGLRVKVESQKGEAEVIRAQDLSGQKIQLKEGSFISWVSETSETLFTMDEKRALAAEGFITPVFAMSEDRKKQLGLLEPQPAPTFADWSQRDPKRDGKGRDVAALGGDLCQAPKARFQQCAWTCEGNGSGASECQAQKEDVHCVRRICNAAGQWGHPTAFASSYADLCPAKGTRVGDCTP